MKTKQIVNEQIKARRDSNKKRNMTEISGQVGGLQALIEIAQMNGVICKNVEEKVQKQLQEIFNAISDDYYNNHYQRVE